MFRCRAVHLGRSVRVQSLQATRPSLPTQASRLISSSVSQWERSNGNGNNNNNNNNNADNSSPPSNSKSKSKLIKSTKPSSKVNARTSRLLRSQLGISGDAIDTSSGKERIPSSSNKGHVQKQSEDAGDEDIRAATAWSTDDSRSSSSTLPRLQEAQAYATASSYDFQALIDSNRLPPDWRLLEDGQVIYLPSWPVHNKNTSLDSDQSSSLSYSQPHISSGEVFILRTGAYVTWGISQEQSRRFRSLVLHPRQKHSSSYPSVEQGSYEEIGSEELDFVANTNEITRIVGDVLIIGQPPIDSEYSTDEPWSPLLARLSFSAGLALSARLSSQETSLSKYLSSVSTIPRLLEQKGRVPIGRKEVVRKMGRLLKLRQMVNLEEGSKVEELELFWENAQMERHYDSICTTLDIESRFRSLNEQLDHAENLMGVLRALLTEGSSHRMELIIIALIAIEVTLALVSHGYLVNPLATTSQEEQQESSSQHNGVLSSARH